MALGYALMAVPTRPGSEDIVKLRRFPLWQALALVLVVAPFFISFLLRTLACKALFAYEGIVRGIHPLAADEHLVCLGCHRILLFTGSRLMSVNSLYACTISISNLVRVCGLCDTNRNWRLHV